MIKSSLSLLLSFLLAPSGVWATITFDGSQEHFKSIPDRTLGPPFEDGLVYFARLQYLHDNINLCPQSGRNHYNVTIPPDLSAVALLARGAYCSDATKARLASIDIEPRGLVKFLIVYDTGNWIDKDGTVMNETEILSLLEDDDDQKEDGDLMALEKRHHKTHYPVPVSPISVRILHVDFDTGNELLKRVLTQSPAEMAAGGPRITMDGNAYHPNRFLRSFLFWFGISIMVVGCCCSLLLSARVQGLLDRDAATPNANQNRPVRRRMTPDQVQAMLPILVYQQDGGLVPLHSDDEEESPRPILGLSSCSICLDDYESDEHIRCLPCGHTFHSNCIAKWLTERSCTCPLCKLDLLPPEDESESSEEEEEELQDGYVASDGEEAVTTQEQQQSSSRESIWDLFLQVGTNWRRRQGEDQVDLEEGGLREPLLEEAEAQPEQTSPPE
mmetsp:Transcript_28444/g.66053  ORF Transcript_28444/g.66053 Transcript_28444/m.66053 type:complete len:443 (-) Transcript_28444:1970-3298(-)